MIQIPWLEQTGGVFPPVSEALREPDGLLAASESLNEALVLDAYARGIFPWYSPGQPVLWWSPDPRCVFTAESFHVSRSFRRSLNRYRNGELDIRLDTAFEAVMRACAAPRRDQDGTWITDAMLQVYTGLHLQGHAHSIECWQNGELVGGMYGIVLGDIFFGESMFSRIPDASKLAMYYLLHEIQPFMLDAQVVSPHLLRMGAQQIPRQAFVELLAEHVGKPAIL